MASPTRPHTGPQLLKLITDALGTTPTESIAMLAPHPHGTTIRRLDLDLDADRIADLMLATIDQLAEPIAGIVLAAYTNTAWPVHGTPHNDLLEHVRDRLEASGYQVIDALVQSRDLWAHTGVNATPAPLPREHPALPDPQLLAAFRTAYLAATARTLHRDATADPDPADLADAALTQPNLTTLATLAAAGTRPTARAAILVELVWGRSAGVDPVQLLTGVALHPAPESRRLTTAETLLRTIAELAGDRRARAGALTMLGWILAAQGRGSAAASTIDHALSLSPDDELASALQDYLDAGNLPPWCTS